MPGISKSAITHKLVIDPEHKPVRQKRRPITLERSEIINKEVDKLLAAGFIREAH